MSFEEASYFFPHGLDYGGRGQSLQELLDSAGFDFAGAPQVARNAQDGHREVFVVGAGDGGTVYNAPTTVTPPGPGISIPATTALNKQPSNTANPQPKTTQAAAPPTDPCASLKTSSPSTYAFCRQQHGLPPVAPAVGFGGVYGSTDNDYYDYGYGYDDDYYDDYGGDDSSSIDSSLKYRRITIA